MKIDYELACQDGCLDVILPSDLRHLVCERDQAYRNIDILKAEMESLRDQYRWRDVRDELPAPFDKVFCAYDSDDGDGNFAYDVSECLMDFSGSFYGVGVFYAPYADGKLRIDLVKKPVRFWIKSKGVSPTPPTSQSNKD